MNALMTPEIATDLHKDIRKSILLLQANSIQIGIQLRESETKESWRQLGWDSFSEYIGAPSESGGLGFPVRTANKLIMIAKRYDDVPAEQLIDVHYTKLEVLAPYVNKDNAEDLVIEAKSNSVTDLKERVREGEFGAPKTVPKPDIWVKVEKGRHERLKKSEWYLSEITDIRLTASEQEQWVSEAREHLDAKTEETT